MTRDRNPIRTGIAIRMADEGIPFRAIQRVLQMSEEDLREDLEFAVYEAKLDAFPVHEWPGNSTRLNRRPVDRTLRQSEQSCALIASEFNIRLTYAKILEQLLRHEVCIKGQLYAALGTEADPKIVDIYIHSLRKALRPFPEVTIVTHWGIGYGLSREGAAYINSRLTSRYNSPISESTYASVS